MRIVPLALAVLAGLALPACDRIAGQKADPNAAKVAEAAANPSFSVEKSSAQPVLALQLLITADAVSVQDARFIRAPLRKGDGQPDLLVIGMADGRIVHKYPIPDPLNAQIEPTDKGLHGTLKLPQASTWIYMPATRIDVVEISPGRDDKSLPRGGRIEIAPLLGRLCANQPKIEDCALAAVGRGDVGAPPATAPGTAGGVDPSTVQSPTLPLPPPKTGPG